MKKIILTTFFILSIFNIYSQETVTVRGKLICGDTDTPIQYANIAIYSIPDSSLLKGGVTDAGGVFTIELDKRYIGNSYLKASFLGFKSYRSKIYDKKIGKIFIERESARLSEVVIKESRRIYKVDKGVINVDIKNTILAKLGNAKDVLARIPFVVKDKGELKVLGRGTPLIYIDNRRLTNSDELRQLKSDMIKKVELILNPGAEYDSSVGAVIKITTLPRVGDGLSGWLYSYADMSKHLSKYDAVSLNYRINGLDLFLFSNYDFTKSETKQKTVTDFPYKTDSFQIKREGRQTFNDESYKLKGGFNYSINENHSFGVWYDYSKGIKAPDYSGCFSMEAYKNNIVDYNSDLQSDDSGDKDLNSLNLYYHNKISEHTTIHFDGDYISGNNIYGSNTIISGNDISDQSEITDILNSDYKFYAGNLWMKTRFAEGEILFGTENSYTDNNQDYNLLRDEVGTGIKGSLNKSEQTNAAAYIDYSRFFGKLFCKLGLRYEHVIYDYFLDEVRQKEESKIYRNLFPMLALSYGNDKFSTTISYRSQIKRPSYSQLLSSVNYIDPYTYESGNPKLKPAKLNIAGLLFSMRNINFNLSYIDIEDVTSRLVFLYKDEPKVISKCINSHVKMLNGYLTYNDSWGIWHHSVSAGFNFQNYNYNGISYNKPLFTYKYGNLFDFPCDWLLSLDMRGNTRGHKDVRYIKGNFTADCSVRKYFNQRKWELEFGVNDIFRTSKDYWIADYGDINLKKRNEAYNMSVYLSLTFNFNSSDSKYRGKSAGKEESKRL